MVPLRIDTFKCDLLCENEAQSKDYQNSDFVIPLRHATASTNNDKFQKLSIAREF